MCERCRHEFNSMYSNTLSIMRKIKDGMTMLLPKALLATEKDNGFGTYSVKIHQNGQPFPFPDKMDALWRLALGFPSLQ
ncbi:putative uncharacterized protein (plasmid) [Aliivibrio wodanis]|uniref:Uncharacterized protein n=1 Tax=Aliivibrio wodanis TaxID=80852 RepID=A0A090K2Q4_9GAMM|nr:putative uncharacterized protein [Aliivibrio wodanis]